MKDVFWIDQHVSILHLERSNKTCVFYRLRLARIVEVLEDVEKLVIYLFDVNRLARCDYSHVYSPIEPIVLLPANFNANKKSLRLSQSSIGSNETFYTAPITSDIQPAKSSLRLHNSLPDMPSPPPVPKRVGWVVDDIKANHSAWKYRSMDN